ncbi:MAG TPA: DciA family protein [Marinobacter sp.]
MKKKSDLKLTPESVHRAPVLQDLLARAQHHQQAEAVVLAAIPESLRDGVRFVCCQEGELTVSAESAVIASQLRYRQHEVMEAVRQNDLFRYIWKLRVKVAPARYNAAPKTRSRVLSNENARLLKEEAGHTKDKNLREVLEKLASHVRT